MYFPYFVAYMIAGFIVSLLVFFWALRHGQFQDQQRARFLPLYGSTETEPVKVTRFHRINSYVLIGLAASGLLTTAVVLVYSIL
jgi:cbb3-type cytochrome oxidase maturation protein